MANENHSFFGSFLFLVNKSVHVPCSQLVILSGNELENQNESEHFSLGSDHENLIVLSQGNENETSVLEDDDHDHDHHVHEIWSVLDVHHVF
jgi:hypothetical protein